MVGTAARMTEIACIPVPSFAPTPVSVASGLFPAWRDSSATHRVPSQLAADSIRPSSLPAETLQHPWISNSKCLA